MLLHTFLYTDHVLGVTERSQPTSSESCFGDHFCETLVVGV